ncbi:MAG: formate--tetrahydrofolate ligase [Saprospiraceae bacterium]
MPTDIQIAQAAKLQDIGTIAHKLGLSEDHLIRYGRYKAKLPLSLINADKWKKNKLILVSAVSPTPAGEGKTTVSIGLSEGMNQIGKKTTVVLREPSLGPVFGIKGGATGGGYAQVLPMEDINLHFTGDFAAIEKAHNLLAALVDNNLQSKKRSLHIDPRTVVWKRVMDMNDRALRRTIIGLGGTTMGTPRETGFDITAASEIMAILCLSQDRIDLKERLGRIFIGFTFDKQPVYARDLNAQGAMAALLKDAIQPNLVQTIEGNPAIIHGGPFANIAQGTNSIIATRMGLTLSDYVVTEAGFGFDLGAEKFFDIKCQSAGLSPHAVVLVATIRALKYHGGASLKELTTPDVDALSKGVENLGKHLENIGHFGVPAVVAINRFTTDTQEEIALIQAFCQSKGVQAVVADVWAKGGAGATELAQAVAQVADENTQPFTPLYEWAQPVETKIHTIATKIYGASAIDYTAKAKADLKKSNRWAWSISRCALPRHRNRFPTTQIYLAARKDFVVTVREIEVAAGAGFLVPITGEIMRMPGLPETPAAEAIDIDEEGNISGLF